METWMDPDAAERAAPEARRDDQGNLIWGTDMNYFCPAPVITIANVQQWAVDAILASVNLSAEVVGPNRPAGYTFGT